LFVTPPILTKGINTPGAISTVVFEPVEVAAANKNNNTIMALLACDLIWLVICVYRKIA
jgi:hypothetical protein